MNIMLYLSYFGDHLSSAIFFIISKLQGKWVELLEVNNQQLKTMDSDLRQFYEKREKREKNSFNFLENKTNWK